MLEYDTWVAKQTPENMAQVLKALEPTINAEIQRFPGPKPLLRSRARSLAVKAVRTYTPTEGAQLRSWVVTQLQPLTRYSQQLRPVRAPEVAIRQAAELNRRRTELSDELGHDPSDEELADATGISVRRIRNVTRMVKPVLAEGTVSEPADEDSTGALPGTIQSNKLSTTEEAVYDSLTTRDRLIFDWKTGKHGKTMLSNQEIAKRLGVTPALISQRSQQIAMQIQDLTAKGIL